MEKIPSCGDESSKGTGLNEGDRERESQPQPQPVAFYCCASRGQHGWLPTSEIQLPIDDAGFRQGVTAVERMRTYGGDLFESERYLARLARTLDLIGIADVVSMPLIRELAHEVINRNREWITSQGDTGLTIWVTPGASGSEQTSGTFAVHLNSIDHAAIERRRHDGQAVVLTSVVQPSSRSWSRWAKVRSRLHYYLADQAARRIRPNATGVLRDDDGTLTESSVANFALVCDGEVVFAPAKQVLRGVTQWHVSELALRCGIKCREQPLTDHDINTADAMMLMGTDTGLWFVNEVFDADGNCQKCFSKPVADSIVRRLQSLMPQST